MTTNDRIVIFLGLTALALVGVLGYSLHVKADAGTVAVAAGALGTCIGALGSALVPKQHTQPNEPPQGAKEQGA